MAISDRTFCCPPTCPVPKKRPRHCCSTMEVATLALLLGTHQERLHASTIISLITFFKHASEA